MSWTVKDGKDVLIAVPLDAGAEKKSDFVEPDWDCPCVAHMMEGPCVEEFKDSFRCFVNSKEEEKGSDCIEEFKTFNDCMVANKEYYGSSAIVRYLPSHSSDTHPCRILYFGISLPWILVASSVFGATASI
jgi:GCK domain-containing protein